MSFQIYVGMQNTFRNENCVTPLFKNLWIVSNSLFNWKSRYFIKKSLHSTQVILEFLQASVVILMITFSKKLKKLFPKQALWISFDYGCCSFHLI